MAILKLAEEESSVRPYLGVSWSHALADAAAMGAFIGAWTSESQKRHAAAAAAAGHASPATANAAAVSPPILPLSLSPSLHHQTPPSSPAPAPLPAPLPAPHPASLPAPAPALFPGPPPSHDRLAILQGARTDTSPFPDLRLDDDPRLASGCFVARQILSLGYAVKFRALSQQVLHIPAEVGLDWPDDARHVIDRVSLHAFHRLLTEVSPCCDVASIIHRALGGGSRRDEGRARLADFARHVIPHMIIPRFVSLAKPRNVAGLR